MKNLTKQAFRLILLTRKHSYKISLYMSDHGSSSIYVAGMLILCAVLFWMQWHRWLWSLGGLIQVQSCVSAGALTTVCFCLKKELPWLVYWSLQWSTIHTAQHAFSLLLLTWQVVGKHVVDLRFICFFPKVQFSPNVCKQCVGRIEIFLLMNMVLNWSTSRMHADDHLKLVTIDWFKKSRFACFHKYTLQIMNPDTQIKNPEH